uniref:Uncharacterized protein n=1 Tax=Amphimedon queenslandica TaxID=400682 RepID=A0A1X7VGY6_AMPQE
MAENNEEIIEVHVEDSLVEDVKEKTEKKKLDRNFTKKEDVMRKRPWRLLEPADSDKAHQEDQSAHQETEEQTDPPEEEVVEKRSVWDRLGERPQPRWRRRQKRNKSKGQSKATNGTCTYNIKCKYVIVNNKY